LEDAAAEFDDDDSVSVYGRATDQSLIEELLDDPAYEHFAFAGEYECLGGVVVESEGSRVQVNNTFDSVFDSVWEDSLKDVSSRLFGEGT
jgi:V/A-type H+-transporting ATPase subunit E